MDMRLNKIFFSRLMAGSVFIQVTLKEPLDGINVASINRRINFKGSITLYCVLSRVFVGALGKTSDMLALAGLDYDAPFASLHSFVTPNLSDYVNITPKRKIELLSATEREDVSQLISALSPKKVLNPHPSNVSVRCPNKSKVCFSLGKNFFFTLIFY
jgi:hypothetical protein